MGDVRRELLRAEIDLYRSSFYDYVAAAWGVIDPEPFLPNWHAETICHYLTALTNREITRLVINVPPGLAKSLLAAVMWPTWEWIENPGERYLFSSYGMDLSTRDTKRSRDLIRSDWYQTRFGGSFSLDPEQDTKTYFENDSRGFRKATSVGGSATGARGKTLVLDDPHKLEDYWHPDQMQAAVNHKNEVLGTRASGKNTRKLVIMQRVGPNDVTEDILQKMEAGGERYEVLALPMRHDPKTQLDLTKFNELPFGDPREEPGDLLHPDLFDEPSVANLEADLGDRAPTILGQKRTNPGGNIFKREWWEGKNRYDPSDRGLLNTVVGSWVAWDTANKKEDHNAFTAGVAGSLLRDWRLLIRYVVMERKSFDELEEFVTTETKPFNRDLKLRSVPIEDAASGTQLLQVMPKRAEPWIRDKVVAVKPNPLGKEAHWEAAADWCRQDCVLLPYPSDDAPWLLTLEGQLFNVPTVKFVDVADAFSHLVNHVEEHYAAFSTRVRAVRGARGEYDVNMAALSGRLAG